jgi:peptidoglycan/LPS O-acetylase OafA/YrhL
VESGWAIAATPAIDANFEVPRDGLFAVGGPDGIPALDDHVVHLRLLAALLAVSAALGPGLFWTAVRARPVAFLLSVPTGAVAATALDVVLPSFLEPALEHLAVGLGAVALATLITALRRGGSRVVPSRPDESSASPGRSERLAWLDALRGLAILGVIGIHVTADSAGLPFAAAEPDGRLVPMVARAVFTALNYPVFLLASFFALAHVLERRRRTYREIVGDRARRLLVPLAVWTLLFVVVRHLKAHAFGYQDAYRAELSSGASWLSYFVLGSAQYHLHFLPLLFGLTLCYPLYRFATWRPWLGGCVLATLALWPLLDRAAYEHVASPEIREYVLRATKTFAYLGYGLYAFALHALHQRGIAAGVRRGILLASTVVGSAAVAILVGHGIETALEGRWLPLGFAVHMARYVLPAVVFTLALAAEGVSPRWLRHLGGLSMGVYLFHPVVLDALEVLQRGYELSPATTTALNFAVVSIVSGVTVSVAQRSKTTARLFFVPAELRR